MLRTGTVVSDFRRFFVAGGTAAAIHFGLLHLFVAGFGWEPTLSTSVAYIVAVTFSYLANYYWTFKSSIPHRTAVPRFVVVAGTGLAWNALIFGSMNYGLGAHYFVAQLVATGLVLFWNFLLQRAWSFSEMA
jgi:putative flippase GtrA